ncbi:hypothetical protein KW794_02365 [Candidatus Saccharibacteria bacterium]|nr:hypothetical protein [Candidatus Saccharibacteria bacterium]
MRQQAEVPLGVDPSNFQIAEAHADRQAGSKPEACPPRVIDCSSCHLAPFGSGVVAVVVVAAHEPANTYLDVLVDGIEQDDAGIKDEPHDHERPAMPDEPEHHCNHSDVDDPPGMHGVLEITKELNHLRFYLLKLKELTSAKPR